MSLETASFINDLVSTNPVSADNVSQGDDHLRLLKAVLKATLPNATKAFRFPEVREATATGAINSTDDNGVVLGNGASGNITLTLPSLVAGDEGWSVTVFNMHATNDTIVAPPSGTISGSATITMDVQYQNLTIRWTGSAYVVDTDRLSVATASRLDNITANRLLGRYSTDGAFQQITIGNGLTLGAGPTLTGVAQLPRGYVDGCILSNGTDATNDINIAAGVCRDSTDTVNITVAASVKELDANAVAGTTGGMRSTQTTGNPGGGTGIADGTYWIYAVATAAGVSAIYAHTSATIATVITDAQAEAGLGASYLFAQCLGGIIRSGATILAFTQNNDEFTLSVRIRNVNDTSSHATAQTGTLTVPLGRKVLAKLQVTVTGTSSPHGVLISALTQADSGPGATNGIGTSVMIGTNGVYATGPEEVWTDVNGQFRYRATDGGIDTMIYLKGWVFERGRNI